jgi:hypothetical protein
MKFDDATEILSLRTLYWYPKGEFIINAKGSFSSTIPPALWD